MNKRVRGIIGLAIVAVAVSGIWLYASRTASGPLTLYGNVDQRRIELSFIDAERIAEVLVEEGMRVKPGDVLAKLETRRLRDRIASLEAEVLAAKASVTRLKNGTRPEEIDQAKAAVEAAKAEAAYASQQYNRYQDIWKQSKGVAVSVGDVDQWRSRHISAKANVEEASKALVLAEIGPRWEDIAEAEAMLLTREKNLEELRNKLGDAELKSPAEAVIHARLMEAGDMASPSRPVFSLAVLSPKWVRAYVSEVDLGRVKPGQSAAIFIDSRPDTGIPGNVGFISPVAEFTPKTVQTPDLRTALVYEVRIIVNDADNVLRLGMPATVTFPSSSAGNGTN